MIAYIVYQTLKNMLLIYRPKGEEKYLMAKTPLYEEMLSASGNALPPPLPSPLRNSLLLPPDRRPLMILIVR